MYFYTPTFKICAAFTGLIAFTSHGLYKQKPASLKYPLLLTFLQKNFFNSSRLIGFDELFLTLLNSVTIISKMISMAGLPILKLTAEEHERNPKLEEIVHDIINSNQKFKKLEKLAILTTDNPMISIGIVNTDSFGALLVHQEMLSSLNGYDPILKSIIIHEFTHAVEEHTVIKTVGEILSTASTVVTYNYLNSFKIIISGNNPILDIALIQAIGWFMNLANKYISRQFEYRADRPTIESGLTKDFMKFLLNPESNHEESFLSSWTSTHPSDLNRLYYLYNEEQNNEKGLVTNFFSFAFEQCFESPACSSTRTIDNKTLVDFFTDYAYS